MRKRRTSLRRFCYTFFAANERPRSFCVDDIVAELGGRKSPAPPGIA